MVAIKKVAHLFTDRKFYKDLLKLGIPIALQQLLYSVFSVIDTSMIAQLGADSTAGVGAATRWMFMLIVTCVGVMAATSSLVSQYWGVKDFYNIKRSTGLSAAVSLTIGVIFTIGFAIFPRTLISAFTNDGAMIDQGAKYLKVLSTGMIIWSFNFIYAASLKSIECVKTTLAASIVSIVTNVFLNWVFIFGNLGMPQMGVEGAALGTVISYYINFIVTITILKTRNNPMLHNFSHYFHWDKAFINKFFKIMTPALLNEFFWVLGNMTYSVVLGRYGNVNYGSYTLFSTVEGMYFTFFIGLSSAGCIIIGKELGKGNIQKGWEYGVKNVFTAPIFAVFLGALLIILRYPILNLMQIPDKNMIDMTAKLLLLYAIASPARIIPYMTIVGIFRAGGDTKTGMWIDLVNVWLVGVPVTLFVGFVLKAPFEYVVLAMFSEDFIKIILCLIFFYKKKWLNQLTHDSEVFITHESEVFRNEI